MKSNTALPFIEQVLSHLPEDWVNLTTHRLDIYNESLAKTEFLEGFDDLFQKNEVSKSTLASLPTAFDYIRLGHPLSSILEWTVGKLNNLAPERVISFSSKTMPILAILRKNVLEGKNTQILYTVPLDKSFDTETLKTIYAYNFEVKHIEQTNDIGAFEGSTILLSTNADLKKLQLPNNVDFLVVLEPHLGSILLVNGDKNKGYIGEIQHVRRRETIAMTPANCLTALKQILDHKSKPVTENKEAKTKVIKLIQAIT